MREPLPKELLMFAWKATHDELPFNLKGLDVLTESGELFAEMSDPGGL